MRDQGLVQEKNLGQVVSKYQRPSAAAAAASAAKAQVAGGEVEPDMKILLIVMLVTASGACWPACSAAAAVGRAAGERDSAVREAWFWEALDRNARFAGVPALPSSHPLARFDPLVLSAHRLNGEQDVWPAGSIGLNWQGPGRAGR